MKLRFWAVAVDLFFMVAMVFWFGWSAAVVAALWSFWSSVNGIRTGRRA
jgi:hypothetical protein